METIFARPSVMPRVLPTAPVLESWDAANHPSQRRLAAYLDEVDALVHACVQPGSDHLALDLTVCLPQQAALTRDGRDLDNYLFPIARRIGAGRLDAVFARKQHAATSTIAVSVAVHLDGLPGEPQLRVRTTSSSQSPAWKQEIRDACSAVVGAPLPDGPLAMGIRFAVSRRRNWSTLWKPAIDALGPVLGTPDPRKPYRPNDDRIVDLALHRSHDDALGNDVDIAVWWQQSVT
ncbi:hypothetical protein OG589_06235 [Sphaerisporangium sp. NBC_01403]|uniref:hypothetical protein n=1 Tax=Sphaerisporangium sp. NBC_01403 TaxID=2903599 RepID=UPI00324D281A